MFITRRPVIMRFVQVIAWGRGKLRINFRRVFKVSPKCTMYYVRESPLNIKGKLKLIHYLLLKFQKKFSIIAANCVAKKDIVEVARRVLTCNNFSIGSKSFWNKTHRCFVSRITFLFAIDTSCSKNYSVSNRALKTVCRQKVSMNNLNIY